MKLIYQRVSGQYFLEKIEGHGEDTLSLIFSDKPRGRVSIGAIDAVLSEGRATVFLSSLPNGTLEPKVHTDGIDITADAFQKENKRVGYPEMSPEELAKMRLYLAKLKERTDTLEEKVGTLRDAVADTIVF